MGSLQLGGFFASAMRATGMATDHWQPQATETKDASTLISTPASAPRPAQTLCPYLKHLARAMLSPPRLPALGGGFYAVV